MRGGMSVLAVLAALIGTAGSAFAQHAGYEAGQRYARDHGPDILRDLAEVAAIPNVGTDTENIRRVAEALRQRLSARGAEARLLELEGANPVVFGYLETPGATHTVTLYAHYDGQPVAPENWATPPFEPTLRTGRYEDGAEAVPLSTAPLQDDWRLYARGTGDDRAPIVALFHALDALRAAGRAPSVNVKFFLEGEEEMGSPNLARQIAAHKDLLASDLWIFLDAPMLPDGRQPVYLGARGVTDFHLTVYGAERTLHSGHYGNFTPDPTHRLALLLAGMRAADGTVTIDGFYDDVRPLSALEQDLIADLPDKSDAIANEIGIAAREKAHWRIEEAVLNPGINILGIRSGAVGEAASNAIPSSATATIGIRTVPEQRMAHLRQAIAAHIAEAGYHILDRAPTAEERRTFPLIASLIWSDSAYEAVRTPADVAEAQAIVKLVKDLKGNDAAVVVGMGGSLPFAPIVDAFGTAAVVLPTANADDNQHAPNENIRLGNLFDAVALFAGLLDGLDGALEAAK